jgi:hypothetical protein
MALHEVIQRHVRGAGDVAALCAASEPSLHLA